MLSLFRTFNLRYLIKHKLRTTTIIFGVALGVIMVVSTMLVNQSILRSYRSLVDKAAGKTDLQVMSNTDSGLPASMANEVASVKGVKAAIPVVHRDGFVFIEDKQSGVLLVYGIDPNKDKVARDYEFIAGRQVKTGEDDAVVITKTWARENNLKIGDRIGFAGVEGIKRFKIVGLLANKGPGQINAGLFAVIDINAARVLFNRIGKVDQVDVVLEDEEKPKVVQSRIDTRLDGRAEVEIPATRGLEVQKTLEGMAFFLNLAAMLAVFVGAFIIFNNLEMSVEERRFGISVLRALGLGRKKIFSLVVLEAILLGFVGSAFGIIMGSLLAKAMSQALAGFVVTELRMRATDLGLTPQILLIGVLLGPVVSAAASVGPASRMLKVSPIEALKPFETAWRPKSSAWKLTISTLVFLIGVGLLTVGLFIPKFLDIISKDTRQLANYLMLAILISFLGSVLLMPHLLSTLLSILIRCGRLCSFTLRMVFDNMRRVPGRTAATITGMMIAIAMMIAVTCHAGRLVKKLSMLREKSFAPDW